MILPKNYLQEFSVIIKSIVFYLQSLIQSIQLITHIITQSSLTQQANHLHSQILPQILFPFSPNSNSFMPSLKTNYIRTDIPSQCFRYEFQLTSHQTVDPKYFHEIQGYFLEINPFIVFSYPFVYSIEEMKELKSFNYMLSNGQKITVTILVGNTITLNSKQVSGQIHKQLMKNTNFLYSQGLNICLNPFDERKITYNTSIMPGFSITTELTQNCIGFYLIPLQAKITQFQSLSTLHEHSIILDYSSGLFYQKLSIVRYDKQNQVVHFRTGEQVRKQYLKALQIVPLNGFQLAMRLSQYYKRLRESDKLKSFVQKWQIKFDSRFMQLPYNFFPVGHIVLSNKSQKSLGECIGSVNAFNFQHNFRRLLMDSSFDQTMSATIYFLLPQIYKPQNAQEQAIDSQEPLIEYYSQLVAQQQEWVLQVINQMEGLRARMKLEECKIVVLRYDVYVGWVNGVNKTIKQVQEIVDKETGNSNCDKIFVLTNYEQLIREQKQQQLGTSLLPDTIKPLYNSITQLFVQQGVYYHLVKAKQNDFRKCPDIVALKTLATIQCKLRLNPLKIKDIPFGNKPLMVVSLHVKQETTGSVTVAAVGSLNAFLSKYTCSVVDCNFNTYQDKILQTIIEHMNKFNSIHKIHPKRIMIFRTGDFAHLSQNQFTHIQQTLTQSFQCKPAYILLTSSNPLRVYNQIDYNYISKDTVKPTQMLCQIRYNNERFIQLENDTPMYKVSVLGVDANEVNFQQKVVELMTKLCFTYQVIVEMRYGKGLGFVGYGEKLYEWAKEFQSIKGMEANLKQGVMIFL